MTKSPINYKQRRENELYWLARAAEHSDIYLADAERVADTLGLAYFNASKQLEKAAQNIFKNFQTAFNLSEAEARQLLEKYYGEKPSQAIAKAVNDITDEEQKLRLQAEMSAPAYQYRIKRLDTLAAEGKKLCETLYKVEVATNIAFLAAEYEKAYNLCTFDIQKGTGVSVAFEHVPKSRIDQVLKTNWSGKHFSTRVWDNTQELAQELSHVMAESFMTGESGYKTAQKIQERFRVGAFEARRLIRTENTYITGQAELESYEKSKIKEYKYAALMDERTSKICRELDGKIFPLSEAQAGKNYPPMHPFCRSSSIPIVPTYEELVAKEKKILEQIPDDMTFDEWLDSLEPTEDGMLEFKPKKKGKSVDKSRKSGIIKSKDVKELEQAKKRDHKIYVTDVAIDKVDKVSLSDFSEEQISAMQRKHKELLRIAKNENDSNEVLLINDLEFKSEVSVLGGEFKVSPGENPFAVSVISNAKRQSLVYLHNHPSTNNFSVGDIDTFVCESAIKTISVVTNQGEVYVLNKTAAYNYNNIRTLLNEIYKSFDGDEIDNKAFVSEFLKRCKEGGVEYGKAK